MSKAIARLLNRPEDLVANMVRKLEDINGSPSEDVRLVAENSQKLRAKLTQLGLDPDDTTGQELYHALRAKLVADSAHLDRALGIGAGTPVGERAAKTGQLINNLGSLPQMWLLKPSAAKALISQMPPKKLMKKLNYHSVQSLLKRENIDNVILGSDRLESESWRTNFSKKIAKLSSASFEVRSLQIVSLPEKYYQGIDGPKSNIASNANMGTVAVWPNGLPADTPLISMATAILSSAEKLSGADLDSKFCEINPALRWWAGNSSLVSDSGSDAVSLNLNDVAEDLLHKHDYAQRTNRHGSQSLFSALLSRYQNQSEKIADSIKAVGYNLTSEVKAAPDGALGPQLAAEYVVAE